MASKKFKKAMQRREDKPRSEAAKTAIHHKSKKIARKEKDEKKLAMIEKSLTDQLEFRKNQNKDTYEMASLLKAIRSNSQKTVKNVQKESKEDKLTSIQQSSIETADKLLNGSGSLFENALGLIKKE